MGYFIEELKDIAKVTGPAKFSLSSNPNFAEFEAMENAQTLIDISLKNRPCRQGGTKVGKTSQTQHYK